MFDNPSELEPLFPKGNSSLVDLAMEVDRPQPCAILCIR